MLDQALQFGVRGQDIARQTDQLLVNVLAMVGNLRHNNEIKIPKRTISGLFSTADDRHA